MNLLLLDKDGSFVDFALRCRAAGHYARVCMAKDEKTHQRIEVGDGLVEKIEGEDWKSHMNWADLILVSDNTKWLRELDIYKKKGFPVFAPSKESADLELDRGKGQALMVKCGLDVIPYETFSNYRQAEKYVLTNMDRPVCKPMGDGAKELSYCSKHPADMVFMLQKWERNNKLKGAFLLQEFVPGVEIAVGGWLGSKGFSQWFVENFEFKPLMNDGVGPNTGEMGTALRYTNDSQLARELLLPLERDLIKMGHTGHVDVAVIVDEHGSPRPLEFTCRPPWPGFNIHQHLHPDPCEWMCHLLDGEDTLSPSEEVAIGVVLAIPPFPRDPVGKECEGIPIYGLDEENEYRDYINPCSVKDGTAPAMDGDRVELERRCMVSAGCYLAVACGCGTTVSEAKDGAYQTVESLEIPASPMYRTDIGDRLKKDIPSLQDCGFCNDWKF